MSKVYALYHIVFCTRNRANTIPINHKEDLYRFIWKKLQEHKCTLIRIGGIQNHIHMLINLSPTIALSKLMQEIKSSSSGWMKNDDRFPKFNGWAAEYYAATASPEHRHHIINYIKNQEAHHNVYSPDEEFEALLRSINQP